jgi:phage-related protein
MSNVLSAVKDGFSKVKEHITGLASQAVTWGKDLIMGIVKGIKSCVSAVGDAAKSVADKIKSFLHFSVPDEGPLTDYESWMPDFMKGLADGIEKSRGMISKAVEGVASDMVINPSVTAMAEESSVASSSADGSTVSGASAYGSGPLIEIKEMNVRSDDDIRKISQELNTLMKNSRRAVGLV